MRTLLPKSALNLLFALAACGNHAVDLDHPILTRSADPTTVGQTREQVTQIIADRERLYWSGSKARIAPGASFGPILLHSCAKQDCASTVITYNDVESGAFVAFGVQGGEIYWFRSTAVDVELVASNVLDPKLTRVVSTRSAGFALAVGADNAFFTTYPAGGEVLSSVPLAGAAATEQLAVFTGNDADTLLVQGDYLYWLGAADQTHGTVRRLRTDRTGTVESLAGGFEYDGAARPWPFNQGGLALDSQYVYWTVSVNAGAILRCPVSGCRGAPEVVAAPVRAPSALLIDRQQLYFVHESDAFKYAISSCVLGHCDQPTLLADGVDTPNVFALDERYVYTATTTQDLSPGNPGATTVAQLRRLPR